MSEMNTIITIGRQFGSGGHEIGKRLAAHYGIGFYDKECCSAQPKKAVFAKSYLKAMTRSLQTAFCTLS